MNININTNLTTLMDLFEKQGTSKDVAWDALKALMKLSKETPAKAQVSQTSKTTYSYVAPNTTTFTAMRSDFWKRFYPTFASFGFTKRGPGSLNKWEKGDKDYMCMDCVNSVRGDRSHEVISLKNNETRITFCNHADLTPFQKTSIENAVGCPILWGTKKNGKLKASVVLPASCWKNAAEWQKVIDTAVKLRDALAPYAYV